jgi:hypothetical protein
MAEAVESDSMPIEFSSNGMVENRQWPLEKNLFQTVVRTRHPVNKGLTEHA